MELRSCSQGILLSRTSFPLAGRQMKRMPSLTRTKFASPSHALKKPPNRCRARHAQMGSTTMELMSCANKSTDSTRAVYPSSQKPSLHLPSLRTLKQIKSGVRLLSQGQMLMINALCDWATLPQPGQTYKKTRNQHSKMHKQSQLLNRAPTCTRPSIWRPTSPASRSVARSRARRSGKSRKRNWRMERWDLCPSNRKRQRVQPTQA